MENLNDNQPLTHEIIERFGFKFYDNDPYGDLEWGENPFAYYHRDGVFINESYYSPRYTYKGIRISTISELKAIYLNRTGKELKPVYDEADLDAFLKSEHQREETNYYKNMELWAFHLKRLKRADPSVSDPVKIKKQAGEIVAILEAANPAPYEYAVNLNSYYADNLKHFIKEFTSLLS